MPAYPPPSVVTPSGNILAVAYIGSPGIAQVNVNTNSTVLALVNEALAVTFVAPSSGKVLVEFSSTGITLGGFLSWGLLDGSNVVVANTKTDASGEANAPERVTVPWIIEDLTPGQSYTYKLAHAIRSGSATVYTEYGGDRGMSVLKVTALP